MLKSYQTLYKEPLISVNTVYENSFKTAVTCDTNLQIQ